MKVTRKTITRKHTQYTVADKVYTAIRVTCEARAAMVRRACEASAVKYARH